MNFQTLQRVLFIGLEELAELERKVVQFLFIQTTNIGMSRLLSVKLEDGLLRQVLLQYCRYVLLCALETFLVCSYKCPIVMATAVFYQVLMFY